MNILEVSIDQSIDIDIDDIVHALSYENSDNQSYFINRMFKLIELRCGNRYNYNQQLVFIARDLSDESKDAMRFILEVNEENNKQTTS